MTKRTRRRAWQWRPGAMALRALTSRQPGRVARWWAARRRGRIGVVVSHLADPVRTLGETADPAVASRATALKWRRLVGSTEGWRVVGRVGDAGVSA